MYRALLAIPAVAALLVSVAGTAIAAPPPSFEPDRLTPNGPATVSSVWRGAVTAEGRSPEVLTGVRVTVGPGGRAGPIRLRVSSGQDPERGTQLGPWVELPAEPGVYAFPAPALRWDYRDGVIAVDQQVGGHAIVHQGACTPEQGQYADLCQIVSLDVFHDLADGDSGAPTDAVGPPERHPGQRLTVTGVVKGDRDRDRVPDDEDRTDLRLTATRTFASDGSSTIRATITNAGPRAVDRPILATDAGLRREVWTPACRAEETTSGLGGSFPLGVQGWDPVSWCPLNALAPSASATVTGALPSALANETITVNASADGEDLVQADNQVKLAGRPVSNASAVVLRTPKRQRVGSRGLRVVVQTRKAGTLRVTVRIGALRSVRVVGVDPGLHRRTVTFRPRLKGPRARTATVTARLTARDGTVTRTSSRMVVSR